MTLTHILVMWSFVLPVSIGSAHAASADGGNLIENGGFEESVSRAFPAPGWVVWGNRDDMRPDRFVLDPSNPKAGRRSLRIEHPAGAHAFVVSNPKEPIPTRPGKAYVVSFWSRTDNLKEPGVVYWESREGASPGQWPITPSKEWTQHTREIHEGVDFFASQVPHIMLAFRPTRLQEASQTLWVDDIVVREVNSDKAPLIRPEELHYAPLSHRLTPGDDLQIRVDAKKRIGQAAREAAGQSFHRLAGYGRHPYDDKGRFVLEPQLIQAIRDCRLPMTRFYATGVEPWPIEETLDKLARWMNDVGVRKPWTVIELEPQGADEMLPPAFWARAARYSVERGYGFRCWEISNEPYTRKATAFTVPDDYVAHVIACSQAIKSVQPDAQIGVGIHTKAPGWGNYVLKQAAGHYDFVVGHYYASGQGRSFEEIALATNYRMLDHILSVNALIREYNPKRPVYQLDTEWGLTDAAVDGRPETRWRNNNIYAAMHRAVRLIYYARERPLRGASGWEMFSRVAGERIPGLAFLTRDAPDKAFLNYWLYYLFNRHCGPQVLDIQGAAPWYRPARVEEASADGPVTPVLATMSGDGRTIYFVIANGSWERAFPCEIQVKGFAPHALRGKILSQQEHDAVGLTTKDEVVGELPIEREAGTLHFTLPGHAIAFMTVEGERL